MENTLNIYDGYMTESERLEAIDSLRSTIELNKLLQMSNLLEIKESNIENEIELKVLTEGLTYDDYVYLMNEAKAEVNTEKASVGEKFTEWLKNIVNAIANLFKSIFGIKSDEKVEVNKDEYTALETIGELAGDAEEIVKAIDNGDPVTAITKANETAKKINGNNIFKVVGIVAGGTAAASTATVAITGALAKKELVKANKFTSACGKILDRFEKIFTHKTKDDPNTSDDVKEVELKVADDTEKKGFWATVKNCFSKILDGVKKFLDKIVGLFKKKGVDTSNTETTDEPDGKEAEPVTKTTEPAETKADDEPTKPETQTEPETKDEKTPEAQPQPEQQAQATSDQPQQQAQTATTQQQVQPVQKQKAVQPEGSVSTNDLKTKGYVTIQNGNKTYLVNSNDTNDGYEVLAENNGKWAKKVTLPSVVIQNAKGKVAKNAANAAHQAANGVQPKQQAQGTPAQPQQQAQPTQQVQPAQKQESVNLNDDLFNSIFGTVEESVEPENVFSEELTNLNNLIDKLL